MTEKTSLDPMPFGVGMRTDGSVNVLTPEQYQQALIQRNADELDEDELFNELGLTEEEEDDDLEA